MIRHCIILLSCFGLLASGYSQTSYFPPTIGNTWATLAPSELGWCQPNIDSLYHFLETNNTKAFILLKDGKIVLEKYFAAHTASTPWYWASAGKSLTAFMVGLAQQDDYLSIRDKTSDYLGRGWTTCSPEQEDRITIWHQLTMTSGLDDRVPNPDCTLDTCLRFRADAGTRWAYHNAPYTLLDGVIENATGMTLNAYITQKLRGSTGITGTFIKLDYNNVFFSTARSMARFGLLILNKGTWNGTPIMQDSAYFYQMTHTSQALNKAYGYLWWLNGTNNYMIPQTQFVFNGSMSPHAPADMIAALGKNGQFINVVPSQNMVWIRMGDAPDELPVPFLLNDHIWQYLNDLACNPVSASGTPSSQTTTTRIFPNPATKSIRIQSNQEITRLEIYAPQGRMIQSENIQSNDYHLNTTGLPRGLFVLKIYHKDGSIRSERIIKW